MSEAKKIKTLSDYLSNIPELSISDKIKPLIERPPSTKHRQPLIQIPYNSKVSSIQVIPSAETIATELMRKRSEERIKIGIRDVFAK